MACVARAARGSFVTILQFLLIRNAAEELNKFHYNYVFSFMINLLFWLISQILYCGSSVTPTPTTFDINFL